MFKSISNISGIKIQRVSITFDLYTEQVVWVEIAQGIRKHESEQQKKVINKYTINT